MEAAQVKGPFIGPRKEMVTPWSTNAVEITQNMAIRGIERIEEFLEKKGAADHFDPMLQATYEELTQDIFTIHITPEPVKEIEDIGAYNEKEGLALSQDEISYLESVSKELGRKLTDSEVFGFSQVNSEHCRHKIFNGSFVIEGVHTTIPFLADVVRDARFAAGEADTSFLERFMAERAALEPQLPAEET